MAALALVAAALAAGAGPAAAASVDATSPGANDQITDAITQTNVAILGEAPAMAMGSLYQTIGNSVAMAAASAVYTPTPAALYLGGPGSN